MAKNPVTGIILAGGKSSRMGSDKGLLELHGKKLIERMIEIISPVSTHQLIISNTADYHYLNLPVYADTYQNIGPLGGIFTGLSHSSTNYNIIVACDMPLLKPGLLELLLTYASQYTIVVPSLKGYFQPLCAFYHKDALIKMEALILQNSLKMQDVIKYFDYKELKGEQEGFEESMFTNINTPAELEKIKKRYEN